MARFALPRLLAGMASRIGHDDAVRNARVELDLAKRRIDDADDLIRRVEAHRPLVAPTARTAPSLGQAPAQAA